MFTLNALVSRFFLIELYANSAKNNALCRLPSPIPAKSNQKKPSSIVNITAHHDDTSDEDEKNYIKNTKKVTALNTEHNHEPKTDEEILKYVIDKSFKSSNRRYSYHNGLHSGLQGDDNNKVINREKETPSPKLDQEDMDILNSIVPEPSIVIVPEPPKQQQQCGKLFEILNCILKKN